GRNRQRASVLMAMAPSVRNAIDRREDGRVGRGGGEPACRIDKAAVEGRAGQEADRVGGRLELQVTGKARGAGAGRAVAHVAAAEEDGVVDGVGAEAEQAVASDLRPPAAPAEIVGV